MLITLLIIFATMWGYLYFKYRDIFAPWSITLLIWIAIISIYEFSNLEIYPTGPQFTKSILIWNTMFCGAAYISFRLTPAYHGTEWAKSEQSINIIKWICIALVPVMLLLSVRFALSQGSIIDLAYNLREQAVGEDKLNLGPLVYLIHFAYVFLIVTLDENKVNKRNMLIALLLCLAFFIVTMSKLTFFMMAVGLLYINYSRKKIGLRPIIIFAIAFVILGILFTSLRASSSEKELNLDLVDILTIYIVSPMVAYCYVPQLTSHYWGEYTFKGVHNLFRALGLEYTPPAAESLGFSYVPVPTNVYTMMAPIFMDFGYPGLFVLSAVEGIIIGAIYKRAETGMNLMRLLYSYLLTILVLQFFAEQFYVGLSNIVQITILILFCHLKFTFKGKRTN